MHFLMIICYFYFHFFFFLILKKTTKKKNERGDRDALSILKPSGQILHAFFAQESKITSFFDVKQLLTLLTLAALYSGKRRNKAIVAKCLIFLVNRFVCHYFAPAFVTGFVLRGASERVRQTTFAPNSFARSFL